MLAMRDSDTAVPMTEDEMKYALMWLDSPEARAAARAAIEAELRERNLLHLRAPDPSRTDVTVVRISKGPRAGERFGIRCQLEDGRTYLRFDYMIGSEDLAARIVPGCWSMLDASVFVGVATA